MRTYIALFRGINVGGSRTLPMTALKRVLEENGCLDVRTYIQSGNAIFRTAAADVAGLTTRLTAAVSKAHGFAPRVLVLARAELEEAAAGNPFPEATDNPTSVHVFFLAEAPGNAALKECEAVRARTERFALKGRIFYLHAPDGFGTSKLAARVERLLGVDATARNWRTVATLLDMANAFS
jgi:uncharacterized protein (DUF1697 family)